MFNCLLYIFLFKENSVKYFLLSSLGCSLQWNRRTAYGAGNDSFARADYDIFQGLRRRITSGVGGGLNSMSAFNLLL